MPIRVVAVSAIGEKGGSHERRIGSPGNRSDSRGAVAVRALLGG